MNFCIISPAATLQKYATLSRSHLVLSHVINPVYRKFYQQRREQQDLIILDNAAYEGQFDERQLTESIGWYHPQVTVLPDLLLGDAQESYNRAASFLKVWRERLNMEWMFVPQAPKGDIKNFMLWLRRGIDDLHPEWIGIPRVLATDICPANAEIRALVCETIKAEYPHIYVHALGMKAGDVNELSPLRFAACNSIDSSAPVWRGWNGVRISDSAFWNANGSVCDFSADPSFMARRADYIIKQNLSECGVKVDGGV